MQRGRRGSAVDPRAGEIASRIPIVVDPDATSPYPVAVAVGHEAVWTLNANTATVTKLDPRTRGVVATVPLGIGRDSGRLAVGSGGVWVSNGGDGTLTRLDPTSLEAETISIGNSPAGLALRSDEVWVAVQPSLAAAAPQPATPVGRAFALPQTFCSALQTEGAATPDVLIATELPLRGAAAQFVGQVNRAIVFTLRRRHFKAGRFTVGYQVCDDSHPREATPSTDRCVAHGREYARTRRLVGLIAPITSGCTLALLPIVNAAPGGPIATISYLNTYIGLTRRPAGGAPDEPDRYYPSGRRNYVRAVAADDYQAAAAATVAARRGFKRFYVLDDGGAYGVGLAAAFRRAAKELGLDIRGSVRFAAEAPSYRALAREVGARGVDAVYIAGLVVPGSTLLADLRAELGAGFPVLGGDGLQTILKQPGRFGAAADGVLFTVPGLPPERLGPAGREFVAAFTREIKSTPLPFVAYVAEATNVLLDAIARSNGTRGSVTARLMSSKVEEGLLGSFSFTPSGDTTAGAVTLYQWRNGGARTLGVIAPSLRLIASR